MRRMIVRAIAVSLCMGLAGCSAPLVGIDSRLAPEQRDQSLRDMPMPPLDSHPSYETATATIDVPVPPAVFSRWFAQTGFTALPGFLAGTGRVLGVARTEALIGGWSKVGDRRRVVFTDGNSAVEQILEIGPQGFGYEVWNLTSDTGRFVTYAVCAFTFTEVASGTRVTWTYAFQPKAQPPDGWFIRSYVQNDFRAFMQAGLAAMAQRAATDEATRPH